MKLLAIDSASSILSVSVSNGDIIFNAEKEAAMKQSEIVMDYIDKQMKEAALLPKDLDGVLCMAGPGSFTGLRIGFSIAKGLSLSLSVPFAPVPSLDCIALGAAENNEQVTENIILAVIQARKNAYFYAFYKSCETAGIQRISDNNDGDICQIAGEIDAIGKNIVLTGPGADLLINSLPKRQNSIILVNGRKGYSREIIAIAKRGKILDNIGNINAGNITAVNYLNSGPEYNRLTDAELRKPL